MSAEISILGQGRHATVYALPNPLGALEWSARKVVSAPRSGRSYGAQPHDIVKEVRILRDLDHPNIISLEDYRYDEELLEHHLQLPLLPLSLSDLIDKRGILELDLVRSVALQALLGLAHLHSKGVAHRDIKPDNIMFDWDGTIKLIDLGTAWIGGDQDSEEMPWRETGEDMCNSVGTGRYRAPELLFSPRSYDAFALDIWALGAVIIDCLGPIVELNDEREDSDGDSDSDDPLESPNGSSTPSPGRSGRKLFDDTYGEVGLAASIFGVLGTPTEDSWPDFALLPDAGKIEFVECQPRPLADLFPDAPVRVLELAGAMLRLDPERRIAAKSALLHPCLDATLVTSRTQAWYEDEARGDVSDRCIDTLGDTLVDRRLIELLRPQLDDQRAKRDIA